MLSEYLLFSLAQRYVIYLKELVEEPLQKGSGDSPHEGESPEPFCIVLVACA